MIFFKDTCLTMVLGILIHGRPDIVNCSDEGVLTESAQQFGVRVYFNLELVIQVIAHLGLVKLNSGITCYFNMSDTTREILFDIHRRLAALDHLEERLVNVESLVGSRSRSYADILMGAPTIGTASGSDHLQIPRMNLDLPIPDQRLPQDTWNEFPHLPTKKTRLPTPVDSVLDRQFTRPQQGSMDPLRPFPLMDLVFDQPPRKPLGTFSRVTPWVSTGDQFYTRPQQVPMEPTRPIPLMDLVFDQPPRKPLGTFSRVTPWWLQGLDAQPFSNKPQQSRLGKARSNQHSQINQVDRAYRSTNGDFTELVKCLNRAGQLLHHGEIWSGTPSFVHSQVDDILTHVTPPMSTNSFQEDLNLAKSTFKQQVTKLTSEHIQKQLSLNTLKLQQLNPEDKEIAAKTALKQLQEKLPRANPTKLYTWVHNAVAIVGTLYHRISDQGIRTTNGGPARPLEIITEVRDVDPEPRCTNSTNPTERRDVDPVPLCTNSTDPIETEAVMEHHDEDFVMVTNKNRKRNRTTSPSTVPIRNFYEPLDQLRDSFEIVTPNKRRFIRKSITAEVPPALDTDHHMSTLDPPLPFKEVTPNKSPLPVGNPTEFLSPCPEPLEPLPTITQLTIQMTLVEPGDNDLESSSNSPSILTTPIPPAIASTSGLNLTHVTTQVDPKLIKQTDCTSKIDCAIYKTLQNATIAVSSDEEGDDTQFIPQVPDNSPLGLLPSSPHGLIITIPEAATIRTNTPPGPIVPSEPYHHSCSPSPRNLGNYNGRRHSLPMEKKVGPNLDEPRKVSNVTVHPSTFFKNSWQLHMKTNASVLLIGDSNCRLMRDIPDHWELHSYPGAKLGHVADLMSTATLCHNLTDVVILVGINHRSDHFKNTTKSIFTKAFLTIKKRNIVGHFVGISVDSSKLDPMDYNNILALNDLAMNRLSTKHYVPALPHRQVSISSSDRDKIHHTQETVDKIRDSIVIHFDLN